MFLELIGHQVVAVCESLPESLAFIADTVIPFDVALVDGNLRSGQDAEDGATIVRAFKARRELRDVLLLGNSSMYDVPGADVQTYKDMRRIETAIGAFMLPASAASASAAATGEATTTGEA